MAKRKLPGENEVQSVELEYVPIEEERPGQKSKTVVVDTSYLNVRDNPSTEAKVQSVLPKGTRLRVIQVSSKWYRVVSGLLEGYVSAEFVKDVNNG